MVRAADCSPFGDSLATTPTRERLAREVTDGTRERPGREATGETRERLAAPGHF